MKALLLALMLLFFLGCGDVSQKYTTIAANTWIGYLPLAYAHEMGWLKKDRFILKWTSSLSESKTLFRLGLCEGFCATQYEVLSDPQIKAKSSPYFFIDQSLGADQILSNVPLQELKRSPKIEVYLELSSVNEALLDAFVKANDLNASFKLNDTTQDNLLQMSFKKPSLIVTYEPYATILRQRGFFLVGSSKTLQPFIRIYDLFFGQKRVAPHRVRLLYMSFLKGLQQLQQRPQYFYEIVKKYIPHVSYEEFRKELKGIRWIQKPSPVDIAYLKSQGFDTSKLLYP